MNNLLLEPPRYFNRIFAHITRDISSAIFLDYLMKRFYDSNYSPISITEQDFQKEFFFLKTNMKTINKKLKKLKWLSISLNQQFFTYTLNLSEYEKYITLFKDGATR